MVTVFYINQNVHRMGLANQIPIASGWLDPVTKHAGGHFDSMAKLDPLLL